MDNNDTHLTPEGIKKLGELARISLSEEDTVKLKRDISDILEYVAEIEAIDTDDIKLQDPQLRNVMREDQITTGSPCAEDVLAEASHTRDGYVVVKKIFQ